MIAGNLHTIGQELSMYPAAIQQGLNFLLEHDLADLPAGRHEIDGQRVFAKVSCYDAEPVTQRRPERHEDYIDIQCIVMGEEKIGVCSMDDIHQVDSDKLASNDILYYQATEKPAEEMWLTLPAGGLAIFFPWDVHRPNCQAGENTAVKKIVVKVAAAACGCEKRGF